MQRVDIPGLEDLIIPIVKTGVDGHPSLTAIGDEYRKREDVRALSVVRCACKKECPLTNFPIYNTGYVMAIDNVCPPCRKDFAKMARIVCQNCKLPVMWVSPHKDKNGFEFIARRTYHVTACPTCFPNIRAAIPVEKIYFDFKKSGNRLPFKEYLRICSPNL